MKSIDLILFIWLEREFLVCIRFDGFYDIIKSEPVRIILQLKKPINNNNI